MEIKIDFEYKIGNRTVGEREWGKHFHDGVQRIAREGIDRKLGGVRCQTHGQAPQVTLTETGEGLEVAISGCCAELRERARRALG